MSNDMSGDPPPASSGPTGDTGRRKPPTIELTAREVETGPHVPPTSEPAAKPEDAPAVAPAQAAAVPPQPEPAAGSGSARSAASSNETPGAAAAAASNPSRRRVPVPALIGAGVAGVAAVALALAVAYLAGGRGLGAGVPEARLALIEQELRDLSARSASAAFDAKALDDLADRRLARLEAALAGPRPAAVDPALADRISTIEGEVKAMAELTRNAARPAAGVVGHSELEALAGRVGAVERAAKNLEAELAKRPPPSSGDRASRLALAAAALDLAVGRGDPFAAELATVKALGADGNALAALEPFATTGVPRAGALARELAALAPALAETASGAPREVGLLEKLTANAERLVRIRPLEAVAGSDPAAVVARIEVKAAQADIAGVLAELAALPVALRAPAEAWIGKAQARTAALAASRRLAADALAGLGK